MGGWEGGRDGGREGGWEGGREGGRVGGWEGGREGGWEGGRVKASHSQGVPNDDESEICQ